LSAGVGGHAGPGARGAAGCTTSIHLPGAIRNDRCAERRKVSAADADTARGAEIAPYAAAATFGSCGAQRCCTRPGRQLWHRSISQYRRCLACRTTTWKCFSQKTSCGSRHSRLIIRDRVLGVAAAHGTYLLRSAKAPDSVRSGDFAVEREGVKRQSAQSCALKRPCRASTFSRMNCPWSTWMSVT
jgi:hypothetical protein